MSTDKMDLDTISQKYVNICRELNMDKETEQKSWKIFQDVSKNFNVEGEPSHWICCALYASCRDSYTPTVGTTGSVIKGNCVSLTKLLRSCSISINEFLTKIRKWIDFTNLSQSFINQIERLERSFGISCVLYSKFNQTFHKIFVLPDNDKKNKKKPGIISSSMLYEFCWCLFLSAKSEDPNHTLDIVTSFHLLLCGLDLIYLCVMKEKRTDLINPSFAETIKTKCPDVEDEFRVIFELCQMHDAQYIEAKDIKMYSFKIIIEKFIKTKILQGNDKNFLDILSSQNFDFNLKSINNSYEQYVLSIGEIDERILLNNINVKQPNTDMDIEKGIKSLIPCTPLTRRHHLPNKETSEPIFNATQNVKKLKEAFANCQFSKEFVKFLDQAGVCRTKIEERISMMCNTFCEKYPSKYEDLNKFNLAKGIYYNLLEKIVVVELRIKPNAKPQAMLNEEMLHTTLLACCVEIVIAAYNSDVKFPWILKCFDIHAFNFCKIIEVVVTRLKDILTRSLIVHLNTIEEKCLDYLVWKNASPLWNHIQQLNGAIPPWSTVDNRIGTNNINIENTNKIQVILSPINSAYECFNQTATGTECARRDLFNVGKAVNTQTPKKDVELSQSNGNHIVQQQQQPRGDTPRKGNTSIKIFLRKFYKLAFMRINELCRELELKNDTTLNQIWTIFEYSIVNKTELMRDRHLDQLIMCAIYVFIKIKELHGKTFTDIMKFYRNQPQATSNIYREVLIEPAVEKPNGEKEPPVYNDIISFYNAVYVPMMQSYVLGFGGNTQTGINLLLSPHPPEKMMSPRKLSANHHLYIKTLEKANISQSPIKYTFDIYKSPAKELEKINQHIKGGRRNLPFDNDDVILKKRRGENAFVTKKVHDVIKARQTDDKN